MEEFWHIQLKNCGLYTRILLGCTPEDCIFIMTTVIQSSLEQGYVNGVVVLGEGLGMFIGSAIATSDGRISIRLTTSRTELSEHLAYVIYFRQFEIRTSSLGIICH